MQPNRKYDINRATPKSYSNNDYYLVTLAGNYYTTSANGNTSVDFGPITIKLRDWNNCKKIARFQVLPYLIQKKDPRYKEMRICEVLKVTTSDGRFIPNMPLCFKSYDEIKEICDTNHWPLRAEMYPNIRELRNKVRKLQDNPQKFIREETKYVEAFNQVGDALDLNADVFNEILDQSKEDRNTAEPLKQSPFVPPAEDITPLIPDPKPVPLNDTSPKPTEDNPDLPMVKETIVPVEVSDEFDDFQAPEDGSTEDFVL